MKKGTPNFAHISSLMFEGTVTLSPPLQKFMLSIVRSLPICNI